MSIESRSGQYGCVFGDWHISRLLGTGSSGRTAVFELCRYNNGWQEFCALKVMNLLEETGNCQSLPEFRRWEYSTAVRENRENAEQEVRLMEQLRGKTNIVDYLDHRFMEWQDGNSYGVDLLIRMERLSDLRSQIYQGRLFSEEEILRVGVDICRALTICHRKGILHRDIKPGNIFFNQDGDYKLGDFGVSRILDNASSAYASTSIGTMAYCAPEQMSGAYDTRVDLYSLGLVLYELRNLNRLPFAPTSYMNQKSVEMRLSGAALPLPEGASNGGTELCQIILKACAFQPEDRYSSADEMLFALENCRPNVSVHPTQQDFSSQITTVLEPMQEYGYVQPLPEPEVTPTKKKKWLPLVIGVVSALIAAIVFVVAGNTNIVHTHNWQGATCATPKTCTECGKTDGVALDHVWLKASCDRPEQCNRCGAQRGEPISHQWVDATTTKPKTCSVCGKTEGVSLKQQRQEAMEALMQQAQLLINDRQYVKAIRILKDVFTEYGNQEAYELMVDCRRKQGAFNSSVIAAGKYNTAVINEGILRVVGDASNKETKANNLSGITSVALGDKHLVCLQSNGSVSTAGLNTNKQQSGINGLQNVTAVAAGDFHSVALMNDGTIKASKGYDHCGECSVEELTRAASGRRIVAISAAYDHTLALFEDGRVAACGDEKAKKNTPNGACNVGWWTDIVAICSGTEFSAGLRIDGTVVVSGVNWDVSGWTDIVNIAAGDYYLVGVRENGTVVAVGDSEEGNSLEGYASVGTLRDVVYISAGHDHTVAVDKYGKVHCIGSNEYGQCDVNGTTVKIN